jgi:hypothetical protein
VPLPQQMYSTWLIGLFHSEICRTAELDTLKFKPVGRAVHVSRPHNIVGLEASASSNTNRSRDRIQAGSSQASSGQWPLGGASAAARRAAHHLPSTTGAGTGSSGPHPRFTRVLRSRFRLTWDFQREKTRRAGARREARDRETEDAPRQVQGSARSERRSFTEFLQGLILQNPTYEYVRRKRPECPVVFGGTLAGMASLLLRATAADVTPLSLCLELNH